MDYQFVGPTVAVDTGESTLGSFSLNPALPYSPLVCCKN